MAQNRCIICGKTKIGLEVNDDFVISAIRWFKSNVTKNEKGYNLVVCKEDYPKYAKDRKRYQRRRTLYVAIGLIFLIVLVISARNQGLALLYGIAVMVFMYALSLLSYSPSVQMRPQKG